MENDGGYLHKILAPHEKDVRIYNTDQSSVRAIIIRYDHEMQRQMNHKNYISGKAIYFPVHASSSTVVSFIFSLTRYF